MDLNRQTARPGAKKSHQLLTMRQKLLWDHTDGYFGDIRLLFIQLFGFSVIRSFLFSLIV